ncbi:MAG: TrbG/VirB9 family P-type conjugative transfer protein [Sphingomonadales bacterium]|jgi:type IV secretion system protein VirB9
MRRAKAIIRRAAVGAALVLATTIAAQTPPPPDPRIQTIPYDAGRIYPVEVAAGYTLMIALANGEHVETMAVGDNSAWQVNANKRGDAIFIKRNFSGINTNLTVITDARTYVFELLGNVPVRTTPLIIRFAYPDAVKFTATIAPDNVTLTYRVTGARSLRPSVIEARNNQTTLAWPPGAAVPAVFQINADGTESLVNGTFVDDRMIIQGMPQRLLFRSGRLLATATQVAARKGRK